MNRYVRNGTLAVFLGVGVSGAALADSAKTLGGIVVTSDDGKFVGSLGGRIQFDYTGILPDKGSAFDSGDEENDSGFYFRRVYISLSGRFYGWRYRIDEDLANTNNPQAGFKDVFVSHDIGQYGTVRIGQTKPYRSMDELVSDLDSIFVERNVNSASGLFGGRQYQPGVFFRYSRPGVLSAHDHFWGGASIYSLSQAGSTTIQGTGAPTQGLGYNARLAYAPIVKDGEWLHLGLNFSSDHADNGSALSVAETAWYSFKGTSQSIISLQGTPNAATGAALTNLGGGNNPTATITQAELSGSYGPVYLQSELGLARLTQATAQTKGVPNAQEAVTFSAQGSYFFTGESRGYDPEIASFARVAPKHDFGAVELAAGYNFIKNRDIPSGDTAVCKPALGAIPTGTTITKCDLSFVTVGLNYYFNPSIMFKLDYYQAVFDLGDAGKDQPKAVNARFQAYF